MKALFDDIPFAYFRTTPEGEILFANHACVNMFDYPNRETFLKRRAADFYVDKSQRNKFKKNITKKKSLDRINVELKRYDGTTIWVRENVQVRFDADGKIKYYEGVFEDITRQKRLENERDQSIHELRQFVRGAIDILCSMVETRDPYTAGHQQRVADLARVIATKMKLPRKKITAIRFASQIHDIGKLSLPSEILTKPGKLTENEFNLIKTHPTIGHDIVKKVNFPWPIATIIYQHHERLDGSGYPNGLTKNEICFEAKILAVADVVEAMATHRPYRPALGIDKALEEISRNKGKLYDANITDVCIGLFKKDKYELIQLFERDKAISSIE